MMPNENKKELVITGSKVFKGACILVIVVMVIFTIVFLVRGATITEIFMENWWLWSGFIVAVIGLFLADRKKDNAQ